MSSHKDNIHNKKLKELLNNSENEPMDDFEKEAMEGFSTLKNENEIFELKASLDKRIDAELFTKEKKQDRTYWYAAAGLIFLIGFSIYFIKNNMGSPKEDLAINNTPAVEAELIQNSIAADTAQFKPAPVPLAKTEAAPAEDAKKTIEAEKLQKEVKNMKTAANDAVGMANNSAPVTIQSAPAEMSPMATSPAPSKQASRVEALSEPLEDSKVEMEEVAVSSGKADRAKGTESKKRKQEERESSADVFVRSSPGATADAEPVSAYYEGGPGALNESLKTKLAAKNLLQNFNATIYINEKKKIQTVVLSNTGELTKDQQKEIIGTLKSLDKFNFSNAGEGKFVAEYKVVFRP